MVKSRTRTSKRSKTRTRTRMGMSMDMGNHTGIGDEKTFHSIDEWYHHEFTILGWMLLAKEHGYNDKINCYKNSLHRLHNSIEQKIHSIHCPDKKTDLKIMLKNLKILIEHVNKDFS